MVLPALVLLGAVTLPLLLSGCGGNPRPARPSTPPPPPPPPPPRDRFARSDLPPPQLEDFPCESDGFTSLREELFSEAPVTLRDYLEPFGGEDAYQTCGSSLFQNPGTRSVARDFFSHMARHDGDPESVSRFDLYYSTLDLEVGQWGEAWPANSGLQGRHFHDSWLATMGAPLRNSAAPAVARENSRRYLETIAAQLTGLPPEHPLHSLDAALAFYLTGEEPAVFRDYLGVSIAEWREMGLSAKFDLLSRCVAARFPEAAEIEVLYGLFSRADQTLLCQACFQTDALRALSLFEAARVPRLADRRVQREIYTGEAAFFPNLPQDTPYPDRQAAIDSFLGTPVLDRRVNRVRLRKYLWVENTEVFSLDSGRPGPTTLVFSPHFDENNPRKIFHWMRDVPLRSGRVIFIPEANRALGEAGGNARPMNGLFGQALSDGRVDYLVVRRVEYLMGMVDGVIGVHDAGAGPFYISDLVVGGSSSRESTPTAGPTPSPWVSRRVLSLRLTEVAPQAQWQIAEFSRRLMSRLSPELLNFRPEILFDESSHSADSTTGYMHYRLNRPAMTIEGRRGSEYGQFLAQAVYTLLLGFGHRIDRRFETILNNPSPTVDPSVYVGLSPMVTTVVEDAAEEGESEGEE